MKDTNILKNESINIKNLFVLFLSFIALYFIIWSSTGEWPLSLNPYNSYVLQAKAWLSGHLDLGRNYSHLEIAQYGGKFFVSFPPFPSVVLLPFVIFNISDGVVALLASLISIYYVYRLCLKYSVPHPEFVTFFLMGASNILLVNINAWVWFFAQNLSFMFTIMSIYYATEKKGVLSLAFWSFAIGCRPFQIVYLPLLLYIMLKDNKSINIGKLTRWFIIPAITAIFYMTLNMLRFNSPFEFGHNYLPEFLEAKNGQFHASYILKNLKSLILMPKLTNNGTLNIPQFNGMSVFLCFPIIIPTLIFSIKNIGDKRVILGLSLAIVHLLLITAHKTMGGYHFGNRYFIDIMPVIFYILLVSFPKKKESTILYFTPLLIFGLGLNLVEIIDMFLKR